VLILSLVISSVLAGSPVGAEPVSLQAPVVDIAVIPSSKTVALNETFTLDIYVYPNGQPVDAVDADLTFNPAYLEVLSIIGEPWELPIELYSAFDNTKGTLTHSRGILQGTPPSSTFLLCSIEFRAKGVTAGTGLAFTDLTDAYFEGKSLLDTSSDGMVVVVGGQVFLPMVFKNTASAGLRSQ
jgi:hypothetical protein